MTMRQMLVQLRDDEAPVGEGPIIEARVVEENNTLRIEFPATETDDVYPASVAIDYFDGRVMVMVYGGVTDYDNSQSEARVDPELTRGDVDLIDGTNEEVSHAIELTHNFKELRG